MCVSAAVVWFPVIHVVLFCTPITPERTTGRFCSNLHVTCVTCDMSHTCGMCDTWLHMCAVTPVPTHTVHCHLRCSTVAGLSAPAAAHCDHWRAGRRDLHLHHGTQRRPGAVDRRAGGDPRLPRRGEVQPAGQQGAARKCPRLRCCPETHPAPEFEAAFYIHQKDMNIFHLVSDCTPTICVQFCPYFIHAWGDPTPSHTFSCTSRDAKYFK